MKQNSIDNKEIDKSVSPLGKINFILILISIALIVIGFILMSGSPNTLQEYNPDIFSTRRIVVGPTISFLGFLCMGGAIIYKKRE